MKIVLVFTSFMVHCTNCTSLNYTYSGFVDHNDFKQSISDFGPRYISETTLMILMEF